jgi:hypothetical protein
MIKKRTDFANIIRAFALAFLCLASALSVYVNPGVAKQTYAVTTKTVDITDNFGGDAINTEYWQTSGGVTHSTLMGALQITNGAFNKAAMWMGSNVAQSSDGKGTPITGSYTMELIMSRYTGSGDWIAVYTGCATPDQDFQKVTGTGSWNGTAFDGSQGSILVFNSSGVINYYGSPGTTEVSGPVPFTFKNDGRPYKFKLEFNKHVADPTQNSVKISMAEYSSTINNPYVEKGTLTNVCVDGYFGFGSMSTGVATVSALKVTQGPTTVFENDFSGEAIDYIYGDKSADKTKHFRVWSTTAAEFAEMFKTGALKAVSVEGGADENALISKSPIAADPNVTDLYELEADLKFVSLGADSKVVVALGMTDGTPASAKTRLEFATNAEPKTTLTYISGDVTDSYTFAEDLSGELFRKFSFAVNNGGNVSVGLLNAVVKVFSGGASDLSGRYAFAAEGENAEIQVTNFVQRSFRYAADEKPNRAIDFSRVDGDGLAVVSEDAWYSSGNAMAVGASKSVMFASANPGSYFGPREPYGDYVLKFDVIHVAQGVNQPGTTDPYPRCSWFGVTLGRPALDSNPLNYPTVFFAPRPDANAARVTKMTVESLNMKMVALSGSGSALSTTASAVTVKENFFEDGEYKKANVVMIVRDRRVEFYFKYDDEPQYVLDEPRAVYVDVNTYGYVAVCCNYGGNFSISNFSITNIGNANYAG